LHVQNLKHTCCIWIYLDQKPCISTSVTFVSLQAVSFRFHHIFFTCLCGESIPTLIEHHPASSRRTIHRRECGNHRNTLKFFAQSYTYRSDTLPCQAVTSKPMSDGDAQPALLNAFLLTTKDALMVFEAARRGICPVITRRLQDNEKQQMIISGSVFAFDEQATGIKRCKFSSDWVCHINLY
jgi:hypothetical protein